MNDIERVLTSAVKHGYLHKIDALFSDTNEYEPVALFYDLDAWERSLHGLKQAFPQDLFFHACAVKTNPLVWFLKREANLGFGAECASIGEVKHAISCGFKPSHVVFDSPCKSLSEIKLALDFGVHLNIDNLQELDRVASLIKKFGDKKPKGNIGVRINPLVGQGKIKALSVSTGKSKFGIPVKSSGPEREALVDKILNHEWINCIHVHTGSGGMGLDQLCEGVRVATALASEINDRCKGKRIRIIDIGGGMPVNYTSEETTPTFADYAKELRKHVPDIFDPSKFDKIVTEFGAALHCKFAFCASRVEYTKSYDGSRIALVHAGSDMFVRAAYCPGVFVNYRTYAFDARGNKKDPKVEEHSYDVAGPLCFAGDVISHGVSLPSLEPNDIIVFSDVGGNALSIKTFHCSRPIPPVIGYSIDEEDVYRFVVIHERQREEDLLCMWACSGEPEPAKPRLHD